MEEIRLSIVTGNDVPRRHAHQYRRLAFDQMPVLNTACLLTALTISENASRRPAIADVRWESILACALFAISLASSLAVMRHDVSDVSSQTNTFDTSRIHQQSQSIRSTMVGAAIALMSFLVGISMLATIVLLTHAR